jgi:hypothetical protein
MPVKFFLEVGVCMLAEVLVLCMPNDVPEDVETSHLSTFVSPFEVFM